MFVSCLKDTSKSLLLTRHSNTLLSCLYIGLKFKTAYMLIPTVYGCHSAVPNLKTSTKDVPGSKFFYYRPQWSCKGYVFTGVCLSTWGDTCASVHAGSRHPPSRHPLRSDSPPSKHLPPQPSTPRADTPLRADTLLQADTPPDQTPLPEQTHPERRPLLRMVRILLECILVFMLFLPKKFYNIY